MREMPALPAHNVRTRLGIVRPERRRRLARQVLHDGGRLPKFEVAVDQNRRAPARVERQIRLRALLALGEIDELQLQRCADLLGDSPHLPGVRRWRKSVQLHHRLLSVVGCNRARARLHGCCLPPMQRPNVERSVRRNRACARLAPYASTNTSKPPKIMRLPSKILESMSIICRMRGSFITLALMRSRSARDL